jgi:hypothetical protein
VQNAETILNIIRDRGKRGLPLQRVYPLQGDQQDSVVRHKSLESRAQGKLAHAVRGGADGKGPRKRDLAGGLLHLEGGRWKRGLATALAAYPT